MPSLAADRVGRAAWCMLSPKAPQVGVSHLLVVNAGSTSLKLHLVRDDETSSAVASLEDVDGEAVGAVAHRVVHGGATFRAPVVIDDVVERELARLTELAPLHNGPAVVAMQEAR